MPCADILSRTRQLMHICICTCCTSHHHTTHSAAQQVQYGTVQYTQRNIHTITAPHLHVHALACRLLLKPLKSHTHAPIAPLLAPRHTTPAPAAINARASTSSRRLACGTGSTGVARTACKACSAGGAGGTGKRAGRCGGGGCGPPACGGCGCEV